MVRPRGAEGLGRRLVDLRAVAQHHREHEAALGSRRHRAPEGLARRLAPARGEAPQRRATVLGLPLQQLRRLAVAERREAGAALERRPQRHPGRDGVAVEQARLLGLAAHLDADPPVGARGRAAALDPVELEQELETSVAQDRVARHAPEARGRGGRRARPHAARGAGLPTRTAALRPTADAAPSASAPAPSAAMAERRVRAQGAHARALAASVSSTIASRADSRRSESRQPTVKSAARTSSGRRTARKGMERRSSPSDRLRRFPERHTGSSRTTVSRWNVFGNMSKRWTVSGR